MTYKEKAEELLDIMSKQTYQYQQYAGARYTACEIGYEAGKKCALIAVDKILNSTPLHPNDVDWDDCGATHKYYYEAQREEAKKYWNEIKNEIEKL